MYQNVSLLTKITPHRDYLLIQPKSEIYAETSSNLKNSDVIQPLVKKLTGLSGEPKSNHISQYNRIAPVLISNITVLSIWTAYCFVSAASVIFNKSLLNVLPFPMTSTIVQLSFTFILTASSSLINSRFRSISGILSFKLRIYFVILSLINIASIFCMNSSLSRLSAAYSQTVKAAMPIFVVLISVFLGETFNIKIYLSLFVIAAGMSVTSSEDRSFNLAGFLFAITSTIAGACYGVFMKKILINTELHEIGLLTIISGTSFCLIFPVWVFTDGRTIFSSFGSILLKNATATQVGWLIIGDGLARFSQNIFSVLLVARLSPVGYSLGNVSKRLVNIVFATIFFHNPTSLLNLLGIFLVMLGLILYNLVSRERVQFPTTVSDEIPSVVIDSKGNTTTTAKENDTHTM